MWDRIFAVVFGLTIYHHLGSILHGVGVVTGGALLLALGAGFVLLLALPYIAAFKLLPLGASWLWRHFRSHFPRVARWLRSPVVPFVVAVPVAIFFFSVTPDPHPPSFSRHVLVFFVDWLSCTFWLAMIRAAI